MLREHHKTKRKVSIVIDNIFYHTDRENNSSEKARVSILFTRMDPQGREHRRCHRFSALARAITTPLFCTFPEFTFWTIFKTLSASVSGPNRPLKNFYYTNRLLDYFLELICAQMLIFRNHFFFLIVFLRHG